MAQDFDEAKEKIKIEHKIKILVDAWKTGDAQKFASPFTEDADFTVWFGLKLNGKEEIAFGHNLIFNNFYANTVWDLSIDKIRFLGPEVDLVNASGAILKDGESKPSEPDAVPLIIFSKIIDEWKFVALQNTPFAVNEFRANGDLKRMKRIAKENMDK
ncbi:MAG: SgcJ/EcaC family oxidoreductase [Flavobacteriaceae bacterium]